MASPTQWTWVWVNSRSWWWTGRPGVLQFMGSQRARHDWATGLNWTDRGSRMTCTNQCLPDSTPRETAASHYYCLKHVAKCLDTVSISASNSASGLGFLFCGWRNPSLEQWSSGWHRWSWWQNREFYAHALIPQSSFDSENWVRRAKFSSLLPLLSAQ